MRKLSFIIFILLFVGQSSYSQLADFVLTVTKTDETCTGNGSLTFNVQNTTPNATLLYSVYLLPNVTTPISVLTENVFTGLSAGNYRVVALQSLGNLSNSQQKDIQINSQITPLIYQVSGIPATCFTESSITVSVSQGSPASYEIISGPVIVPPQSSNVFTNLPAGSYNIRVNDSCGDAVVQTFTLLSVPLVANFTISPFETVCSLVNCTTISGTYIIQSTANSTLIYPLSIVFTVFPPNGGTPIIFNQTISSGDATAQVVNLDIPFYHGQLYNYSIKVSNGCGLEVQTNSIQINKSIGLELDQQEVTSCSNGLNLGLCNFVPPFTVEFLSTPSGFNPLIFNSAHPGPFTNSVSYLPTLENRLPNGNYVVKVTDSCGNETQNNITIRSKLPDYKLFFTGDPCNPDDNIQIPNVGPEVTSVIITNAPSELNFSFPYDVSSMISGGYFVMPLTQPGTYTFTGINICGDTFNFEVIVPPFEPPTVIAEATATLGCLNPSGKITLKILGGPVIVSVILEQAPVEYGTVLPQDISEIIEVPNTILQFGTTLPAGDYTFRVTDSCGNVYIVSVTVPVIISELPLVVRFLRGCETGNSSILLISRNGGLNSVIITAAPSGFIPTLPHDVSFNIITSNRNFCMNSLPPGNYTFKTIDVCGFELISNIVIPDYIVQQDNITIQANCGSFNVVMQYVVNENSLHNYWLQKFNSDTNQWEHPLTGQDYVEGSIPNSTNSYPLVNLTTNYNIVSTGVFRIVKRHSIYSNGLLPLTNCIQVIKNFEFNNDLKILSATTFPCANGVNEVVIEAEGFPPLSYSITSKNGSPFIVNNGNSNIFSGLEAAIYNFQVKDLCGNIVNRLFDINSLPEPTITPSDLCDGQVGQLSVQAISFLSYQWWRGSDTATILSTTNVLPFNPFSSVTTPGTYSVRIYSTTSLSCVDKIISYTIPSVINPNAGNDVTKTLCDLTEAIDLFSILEAPFDNNGVWEEITSSGMLNGSIWLPLDLEFGTYIFKYTVTGFCSETDSATVTIIFNEGPTTPILGSNQEICNGETIAINLNDIPNATFNWTGPNDFSSSSQNVLIENSTIENVGTYTVTAMLNGCMKTASIDIGFKSTPNVVIEEKCVNGFYTLKAVAVDGSFDPELVNYSWTGPNSFSSNENPITISNNAIGMYSVTVTNQENCSKGSSFNVLSTSCTIPNVITPNDDGSNESFDLSGFDVLKLEIYNRWGRLVYEQNDYIAQWRGQNMNGGRLPDSTYFYLVFLRSGEIKNGWVFLASNRG
ncbi:gliding motility-associated C-terminal domain-containing protein [Flavobacterium dankookense]|uniref:Gliding motility-associated-like protein n=1 Tax=Flavobacterium dankookense TaxID=706186 RepID=A0A4R6Q717_9FLAO|nr:gliding motility-associated C-terminal domain-containing protein [Flavobacterium dankookense]TDP57797.1 gliding motility-associated-like protein [Flavobacterium dankookense]